MSYDDTKMASSYKKTSENASRCENFHHSFILGLLIFATEHYEVYSNKEFGEGRPDMVLIPKDKTHSAYIFELKWTHTNTRDSKTIPSLLTLAKK